MHQLLRLEIILIQNISIRAYALQSAAELGMKVGEI